MADDLDALLSRADSWRPEVYGPIAQEMADLAAALRESRADYHTALDVIARLSEGWKPVLSIEARKGMRMPARFWKRGSQTETMSPEERAVLEQAKDPQ